MIATLIGDIGGTKSSWYLRKETSERSFKSSGFNPFVHSDESLLTMLDSVHQEVLEEPVEVFYYGSGVSHQDWRIKVEAALQSTLRITRLEVHSDLLGAARGVCIREAGLVGILGTGSNLCHYDGHAIDHQANSLGWPLGDEGSGTHIAKKLIRALYYNHLSAEAESLCHQFLPRDRLEFLSNFKTASHQNQFLAGIVKKMAEFKQYPEFQTIVRSSFKDFLAAHLGRQHFHEKINFIGSIAFYFCDDLRIVLQEAGYSLGRVERDPLNGLIKYHLSN